MTPGQSPKMIEWIKQNAKSLGAKDCPGCGVLDYGFGIKHNNKHTCLNCHKRVPTYSKAATLRFSLEVLRKLLADYDDYNTPASKSQLIPLIDELLRPIVLLEALPAREDVALLNKIFDSLPPTAGFGSNERLSGGVFFKNGVTGINAAPNNLWKHNIEALVVVKMCIDYIKSEGGGGGLLRKVLGIFGR